MSRKLKADEIPQKAINDNDPNREILTPAGCRELLLIKDKAYAELIKLGLPKVTTSNSYRHVRFRVIEWLATEGDRLTSREQGSSSTTTEP